MQTNTQMQNANESVALSLYAVKYGVKEAEKLANKKNLTFDKELALQHIDAFLGEGQAESYRRMWDESYMNDFKSKLSQAIKQESQQQLAKKDSVLDKLYGLPLTTLRALNTVVKRGLADIMQGNPANSFATVRNTVENKSNNFIIEPTVDRADDRLFIDLRLNDANGINLPDNKEQYKLIINTHEVDFDFEFEDEKNVVLDTDFPENFDKSSSLILKYNKKLSLILVIIGEDLTAKFIE